MTQPNRISTRSMPSLSPHGLALLRDPLLNKGTAFTEQERDALGLRGFLPAGVLSMQAQVERVLTNLRTLPGIPSQLHFFVFEGRALAAYAWLLGAASVAAAVYPMRIVATLPIAPTLRREVVG